MASFVEVHGHARDEGNFEALYETYKHDVQRLASYLLKNATDAEDAAQTVFMNVLRALRQGVTPTDPRAWLLAITRNVCFSRGRAAAARPDYIELDDETASQPSDDQAPTADEIVGALARMRPNQRTALILRDFRGVSRAEISHLMSLSAVSVEALLTRARASFREELEAGDQPFVCAETRALVEQQLDGLITVADRHSLRTHLRHCSPCSSLARTLRSTRGRLAGLIFWPVDLISRLVGAFSQAPAVVHVAAAIGSTAAVATVAIPVAITNGPAAAHVEGRTARAPAYVVAHVSPAVIPHTTSAAAPTVSASHFVPRTVSRRPATAPAHKSTHARTHTAPTVQHSRAAAAPKTATAPAAVTTPTAAPAPVTTPAPSAATTTGSVHTLTQQAAHPASPVVQPVAAAPPSSSPRATSPRSASPRATSPHGTSPRSTSPRSSSPRSSSPSTKPKNSPAKRSPAKKASKRRGGSSHSSQPPLRAQSSSPPAATLPPPENGASGGAGPGFTPSAVVSPPLVPAASAGSSQGGNTSGSASGDNGGSNGNGDGHGKHHKK